MGIQYRMQERKSTAPLIEYSSDGGETFKPFLLMYMGKKAGESVGELIIELLQFEDLIDIDTVTGMITE